MSGFFAMNVGTVDRAIRIAAGIALLSLAYLGPQTAWGYLGVVPLITGAGGWCPLYALIGFSTCGRPHRVETSNVRPHPRSDRPQ